MKTVKSIELRPNEEISIGDDFTVSAAVMRGASTIVILESASPIPVLK